MPDSVDAMVGSRIMTSKFSAVDGCSVALRPDSGVRDSERTGGVEPTFSRTESPCFRLDRLQMRGHVEVIAAQLAPRVSVVRRAMPVSARQRPRRSSQHALGQVAHAFHDRVLSPDAGCVVLDRQIRVLGRGGGGALSAIQPLFARTGNVP